MWEDENRLGKHAWAQKGSTQEVEADQVANGKYKDNVQA